MNIKVDSTNASQQLGRTLRALRLSRHWTLNDFERASGGRIKAVVLGSYERASRSITVSKLEEIACVFQVPISALLAPESNHQEFIQKGIVIDLRKLRDVLMRTSTKNLINLNSFVCGIIDFRRDWNGEILSLRSTDLNYLAIMSSANVQAITKEYAELKILFELKD